MARQIHVFKAISDVKVEGERRRPYRTIAMPQSSDLYSLAQQIVGAFGFDFDHAFGFMNTRDPYRATVKYEVFGDQEMPLLTLGPDGARPEADEAEEALERALEQIDMEALQTEVSAFMLRRMRELVLPKVPVAVQPRVSELLEEVVAEAQGEADDPLAALLGGLDGGPLPLALQSMLGPATPTEEYGVRGVPVEQVFTAEAPTWTFLFDYGDDWTFEVQYKGLKEAEKGARYPKVLESVGTAPEQYPDEEDWDEDDEA